MNILAHCHSKILYMLPSFGNLHIREVESGRLETYLIRCAASSECSVLQCSSAICGRKRLRCCPQRQITAHRM